MTISQYSRACPHYAIIVRSYINGWYLFWYQWKEYVHSYTLVVNLGLYDLQYWYGVATTPAQKICLEKGRVSFCLITSQIVGISTLVDFSYNWSSFASQKTWISVCPTADPVIMHAVGLYMRTCTLVCSDYAAVYNVVYYEFCADLRGYCTPGQFLDCFCIFLKNHNTLVTSKICFL